jgi:uncharacterized protein (TIGR00369 family)
MTRSKTITWADPAALAAGAGAPGLTFLQRIAHGELPPPPFAQLLGFELREVGLGRAVFAASPDEEHLNANGVIHGGIAAALLDSAMGCAVQTMLPAGTGMATIELKVNYTRPLLPGSGEVIAEGTVVHSGSTILTAEGRITSAKTGKLLAHATTTCMAIAAEGEGRALRAA